MKSSARPQGVSFIRRRSARAGIGAVSVAGFALFTTASPALAATDADCAPANTVDATASGTAADIQTLLTADTPIICLVGTFNLEATLTYDYGLRLYGLSDAVLDGGGDVRILEGFGGASTQALEVQNITFRNGSSSEFGGAIFGYNVLAFNSRFENNSAFFGGAIFSNNATTEDSTFVGNSAAIAGGAIAANYVVSRNSTFESNSAEEGGGAIVSYQGVAINNSTFVANSGGETAGAIFAGYGQVLQSTFVGNTGGGAGESIAAEIVSETPAAFQLLGNIFTGPSTQPQLSVAEDSVFSDLSGNVFSTGSEPALLTPASSTQFGKSTALVFNGATLADNGGPTQTVALWGGSPALGVVPPDPAHSSFDQRGVERPEFRDAGAYEYVGPVTPLTPAALPATGVSTPGWLAGAAGAMLALGVATVGVLRRLRA